MQIDKTISNVEECDLKERGRGWGCTFQIKVETKLQKTITRGRTINLRGRKMWTSCTYEKLPKICFKCEQIVHEQSRCERPMALKKGHTEQFGSWLQTKNGRRQYISPKTREKQPMKEIGDSDTISIKPNCHKLTTNIFA